MATNSWGDEEDFLPYGRYTERTADVDRFMWRHKDTLVFFAAGNDGGCCDAPAALESPGLAKSVTGTAGGCLCARCRRRRGDR